MTPYGPQKKVIMTITLWQSKVVYNGQCPIQFNHIPMSKKKKHIYGGCSIATFDYRRVLINSNHSYSLFSFALGSSGASWGGICRGALARLHIMESD
jgi:hypothetical protein